MNAHLNLSTLTVEPDLDPPTPPAAPAARPRKPFNQSERDARGLELSRTRAIVGAGSVYFVEPSDRTREPYRVDTLAGSCSCGDAVYAVARERARGNVSARCKHLAALDYYLTAARPMAA